MSENLLTQKRLREVLEYSPESGIFVWKIRVSNRIRIGDTAGHRQHIGYIHIAIDNKTYYAHRLAFLYMEGYFPENDVDHLDGVRNNNRWKNLRHASRSCNLQNTKLRPISTSGFMGVSWSKYAKKWHARICIHRKRIHLGYYDTAEEAAIARCKFEDQHPDWTCDQLAVNRVKLRSLGYEI